MDNTNHESVPYIVHEGSMVRMERTNRRLWILCIILVLLLVISNASWIWYESQFEDVVTTEEITQDVTQDSGEGGYNSFIGGDSYGTTDSKTDN